MISNTVLTNINSERANKFIFTSDSGKKKNMIYLNYIMTKHDLVQQVLPTDADDHNLKKRVEI